MQSEALIVVDLGFGDSGKGTMVDYLARQARSSLVIRYNGGPQAAHNVITPDGRHHTFSQLGSSSFLLSSRTHLSRYMLVNPFNLYLEAQKLQKQKVHVVWERLSVDGRAVIITPWHVAANRIREMSRGEGRHGSCGQGVGEARWDDIRFPDESILARHFHTPYRLKPMLKRVRDRKLEEIQPLLEQIAPSPRLQEELEVFQDDALLDDCIDFYKHFAWLVQITGETFLEHELKLYDRIIFEGAQGVLLDEKFGFHPYTTWTNTTMDNALQLLADSDFGGEVTKLGVIRGYATRHGAGPFVTEDAGLAARLPDYHNGTNDWQQSFRVGYLDLPALNYSLEVVGGVDALAVTGLDRMIGLDGWKTAVGYDAGSLPATPFLFQDQRASRMRVIRGAGNRAHQIALANYLLAARPVYQEVATPSGGGSLATPADMDAYLGSLSTGLNTPIRYLSFGPTAEDKRELKLAEVVAA